MSALARYGWLALIVMSPGLARAECPSDAAVAAFVADFQASRTSKGVGSDLTLADAECSREKVMKEFTKFMGPIVGYKTAMTSPEARARNKLGKLPWAYLYGPPMQKSGARIPAKFGATPRIEGDFLIVVKDAGLADAKTSLEGLKHVSSVIPFIELVDLLLEESNPIHLIATNIAFRGGVMGPPVPVEATQAFLDRLIAMDVVMIEEKSGKEIRRVKGSAALNGDPIAAVMALAQELKRSGVTLKSGDILSLGNYHPPAPAQPGTTITVKYLGLPGDPAVTAHFE